MRNLTLTFLYMEREHIGKDVSCVPYYLGKILGYEVDIVSLTSETNGDIPEYCDDIHYRKLFHNGNRKSGWYKLIFFWWYLVRNAKRIDILMRFHYSLQTVIEVIIYKLCNPKGKVYVKSDANKSILERFSSPRTILQKMKLFLFWKAIKNINIISSETTDVYNLLKNSNSPYFDFKEKLMFIPNGFDEELLRSINITIRKFEEKENIMITVGRLGDYNKNTEMLIKALSLIEMHDWKFYLIGTIEETFKLQIDLFFEKHPEKKQNVFFLGEISDKRKLWDFYNRAKIFVFTSRSESYGLVLNEAKRFSNYILSTDVGAANDLIANRYGELIPQDDFVMLADCMQHIIDLKTDINVYENYNSYELSWAYCLQPVVERLKN